VTSLSPPVLLTEVHELAGFDCGAPTLDDWLKRRARANQVSGASRSYVVAEGVRVVGYYCLASGAIAMTDAPTALRRNMPDPIPVTVLGRLGIDQSHQGKGLGTAMLQDAVLRTMQAAEIVGSRGLLVHAISDSAKALYARYGFVLSPTNPMMLVLSLKGMAMRTLGETA
jgi:GNAT superfamily N-acetyltransferase